MSLIINNNKNIEYPSGNQLFSRLPMETVDKIFKHMSQNDQISLIQGLRILEDEESQELEYKFIRLLSNRIGTYYNQMTHFFENRFINGKLILDLFGTKESVIDSLSKEERDGIDIEQAELKKNCYKIFKLSERIQNESSLENILLDDKMLSSEFSSLIEKRFEFDLRKVESLEGINALYRAAFLVSDWCFSIFHHTISSRILNESNKKKGFKVIKANKTFPISCIARCLAINYQFDRAFNFAKLILEEKVKTSWRIVVKPFERHCSFSDTVYYILLAIVANQQSPMKFFKHLEKEKTTISCELIWELFSSKEISIKNNIFFKSPHKEELIQWMLENKIAPFLSIHNLFQKAYKDKEKLWNEELEIALKSQIAKKDKKLTPIEVLTFIQESETIEKKLNYLMAQASLYPFISFVFSKKEFMNESEFNLLTELIYRNVIRAGAFNPDQDIQSKYAFLALQHSLHGDFQKSGWIIKNIDHSANLGAAITEIISHIHEGSYNQAIGLIKKSEFSCKQIMIEEIEKNSNRHLA
ncbi:MAG: hypothetical protein WDZ28_02120 [Simkaniaceae bacterium]